MTSEQPERPWLKLYDGIPADVDVPDATMYEMLVASAAARGDRTAFLYLGRRMGYTELLREVDACAAAFTALGVGVGDAVVLSLPNVPAVVIGVYALNKIGAKAVMTHPLSSGDELTHYITTTGARWVVTVDLFYRVFHEIAAATHLERLIIAGVAGYLGLPMRVGYALTRGRKVPPVPADDPLVLRWDDFMKPGRAQASGHTGAAYHRPVEPGDTAAILFSGGTTNLPKGIDLSNSSFNALAVSMIAMTGISAENSLLAILPAFHGFGLGLCIHTVLCVGAHFILVPEFTPAIYIDNLVKYSPSYIAGVPTLFQALLSNPKFTGVRFEKLKGAFSGGDMLSPDLKRRFDTAIAAQGSPVELIEGYGLTECVTGCAISPPGRYRENSMGIPMPGVLIKVADSATGEELPYGTEGEICVAGPTLMRGYVNDPEDTAQVLRTHADGRLWLHTRDIGTMDPDGYLYFKGRSNRLIKVSGMAVYPVQVEQVLESHPLVNRACAIGLPDDYQMSVVKAFVVLTDGSLGSDAIRDELRAYCKEKLIKYAVPRQIEFRTSLPTTRVGKIAFTELEREEAAKRAAAQAG